MSESLFETGLRLKKEKADFYENWSLKFQKMLDTPIKIGEELKVVDGEATVRKCVHTGRDHLMIVPDCIMDEKIEPRRILVSCTRFRGRALKAYLPSPSFRPIHKVRIIKISASSVTCEIIN